MKKKKTVDIKIIKELVPYILNEKWLFTVGLALMLAGSVLRLIDPLIIAHIVDNIVPVRDLSGLYRFAGLFVVVILFSGICAYLQVIILSKMGIKIVTKLKFKMFDKFLHLPVGYFDKNPVGELIARVESDCENVRQLFSDLSVTILGNILFFLGMLTVMFLRHFNVTLILLIPVSIVVVTVFFLVRYLSRFFRLVRELNTQLTGIITEYIQGISIVQLFNRRRQVMEILKSTADEKRKVEARATFTEYSFWGLFGFLIETMFVVILIYILAPQILAGLVTIGTLIIFIQYTQRIFWPLMMVSENINQVQRAFVSLSRIFTILRLEQETGEQEQAVSIAARQINSPEKSAAIPVVIGDSIEFRDVSFRYKKDEWVLRNVDFTIKKGEKIALVGASGSGKTTTVSLLCRFYPVTQGAIYTGGVNICDFDLKKWRRKIGLVLQDIYLFPGNVKENIRIYDDSISDEQIFAALRYVDAENMLKKLNKGLNSEILERGQNLSVGEKQLLSFARAIVFDPEIIILDEATASVDVRTEMKIQNAMDKMLAGKTAIIVAHRLSSVIHSDKILFFSDGEIIASGTHNELLDISGEYRKLVDLQFLGRQKAVG